MNLRPPVRHLFRAALGLFACAALAAAAAGDVVVIRSSDIAPYKAVESSFTRALNRSVQSVSIEADAARARALLSQSPALVLAIGPDATRLVSGSGSTAPALFALLPDPDKFGGDVASHAVPMFVSPARQLKVIREVLPRATRLGVVFDPKHSSSQVEEYERAARAGGVTLVREPVANRSEVASAVRGLMRKVDAVWLVPDATVIGVETFKFMVETSFESRVPLIGFSQSMAKAGALVAIEAEYPEIGRSAASTARRVLSGGAASPDSPDPTLYLNERAAELMGISLPDGARKQARKIF